MWELSSIFPVMDVLFFFGDNLGGYVLKSVLNKSCSACNKIHIIFVCFFGQPNIFKPMVKKPVLGRPLWGQWNSLIYMPGQCALASV